MVKFMRKKEVRPILKQLQKGGFTVTNDDGWWKALDSDGTHVLTAMPQSNGDMVLRINEDYFS